MGKEVLYNDLQGMIIYFLSAGFWPVKFHYYFKIESSYHIDESCSW
jgi:hypothetical protein